PGEHGYRFFPSFYRHLFDVMRRTPIFDEIPLTVVEVARRTKFAKNLGVPKTAVPRTRFVESGRTVYDNLTSARYQSIAQANSRADPDLSRQRPRAIKDVFGVLRVLQEDLRFEWLDLARFSLKLLEYLTAHPDRRKAEHEGLSWAEFIGARDYSQAFQESLDVWPQALVGMRAHEADARTMGSISVQMILDQLRREDPIDATLNAPTSVAWFDHWRRYLEAEGVTFHRGSLKSLRWDG